MQEAQAQAQATINFLTITFEWVAYTHAVREGEALARLLMIKDNTLGLARLSDRHRATLESAIKRWPLKLSVAQTEALGCGVALYCGLALPEEATPLKDARFCPRLKRQDQGDRILIVPSEELLIDMHSQLENKTRALSALAEFIREHDLNCDHLQRMERRMNFL